MSNNLVLILGGLSMIGLIALLQAVRVAVKKACDFFSDRREASRLKANKKEAEKLSNKCREIVYGTSKKEVLRRGQLEINNMALILAEVKEIDQQTYDELVVKLASNIRKEEVKQGLATATELTDVPSFFGDDGEDDLVDFN